jgi:hypothetical protein
MISLKEIMNTLRKEESDNMTQIDNWKITDHDFLIDMGFKPNGIYHFAMEKPKIKVSHKKDVGFVLEDEDKKSTHHFKRFRDLAQFFSKYNQKWQNEPYKS